MLHRRTFIKQSALAGMALLPGSTLTHAADFFDTPRRLTILHTNDMHSRIDPFPQDGSRNAGQGGVAGRAQIISRIRSAEENVLLFDAGDIFQGTPYFNIYKGEPEIKAMTAMGYDATTIGNHDFDAGLDNLALQLHNHARFPMLVSNYNFSGTSMEQLYAPYKIFKRNGLKIGVLGIGIKLEGLVPENLYGATQYIDPVQSANTYAQQLKDKNCDLVVCLSHLGYKYESNKISDLVLARETKNIDVIIGGHTHTFLDAPDVVKNKAGEDVIINQVGFAGLRLGRLDFVFEKKEKKLVNANSISVSKKTE